jgi:hypothetical protein
VFLEMSAHPDDDQGWSMTEPVLRELRVGQLTRQLTQGQREGVFGEFSPEIMAMAVRQAIDGVAAQLTADPELDLERYGTELADLFERTTKTRSA